MIQVYEDSNQFVLRDEKGTRYGVYRSRQEASDRSQDWNDYYAAPLVSIPTRDTHTYYSPQEVPDNGEVGKRTKSTFPGKDEVVENTADDSSPILPEMSVNPPNDDFPLSLAPATSFTALASENAFSGELSLGGRPRKWNSDAERKQFSRAVKRSQIEEEIRKLEDARKRLGGTGSNPRLESGVVPAIKGSVSIPKPASQSELELTAELLVNLRNDGYTVHAEVCAPAAPSEVGGKSSNRLDIVLFKSDKAVGVIEVKKGSGTWSKRQKEKYAIYGVPQLLYNKYVPYQEVTTFANECLA